MALALGEILGKTMLVGITYHTHDGQPVEQKNSSGASWPRQMPVASNMGCPTAARFRRIFLRRKSRLRRMIAFDR